MAIKFPIWIDGIVGNARVIADRKTLKRVWINHEGGLTSITSFDEAYEQLFDDLDALTYVEAYSEEAGLSKEQGQSVREYIESFRDFDDQMFVRNGVLNVEAMLNSSAWAEIETKAQKLVSLFKTRQS